MKFQRIIINNYLEQYKTMNFFTHIGLAFQNVFTQEVMMRFIRAFFSGMFSGMVTVAGLGAGVTNWASLQTWISALMVAGIIGAISGLVMAGDKAWRMTNSTTFE